MNQQEWIEYFELVNGRKPTPAELAQAQAAGEFILERPNPNVFGSNGQATEQRPIKPAEPVITMTQQPQFAQTTATFQQVVPAKKGMSKKTKIILASVFGSLAAILLIVGGYSLWRYQSGKIADGTYEVVSFSYYNEDKNRMVDGIKEYEDEDTKLLDFLVVKKNQSNHYNYLESDGKSSISLIQNEKSIPQKFDPWNRTQSQVLSADDVKDLVTDYMKKMSKEYSFYSKDDVKKTVKTAVSEYKDTLKETRTYVKHGDEFTLNIYDKKGKLKMTTTYKLMSREDGEERKDDYDDAVKDYKKDLKEISDKYDEYSDYGYGYGYDYGYGYGNDYGDTYGGYNDGKNSGSKSDSSDSSKKSSDKI